MSEASRDEVYSALMALLDAAETVAKALPPGDEETMHELSDALSLARVNVLRLQQDYHGEQFPLRALRRTDD